jgi:hypothetical protein
LHSFRTKVRRQVSDSTVLVASAFALIIVAGAFAEQQPRGYPVIVGGGDRYDLKTRNAILKAGTQ